MGPRPGKASQGIGTGERRKTGTLSNSPLCVSDQNPPSINGPSVIEAFKRKTKRIQFTSNSKNVTFSLGKNCTDFKLFGKNLWLGG
jgi:hypothetical protein